MFQRQIRARDVKAVVLTGEVIAEWYEYGDEPYGLFLGFPDGRPIHAVVARRTDGTCIVVTVYEPDPERWTSQFKRRQPK
jgi:uncharacterized protein DUF4258